MWLFSCYHPANFLPGVYRKTAIFLMYACTPEQRHIYILIFKAHEKILKIMALIIDTNHSYIHLLVKIYKFHLYSARQMKENGNNFLYQKKNSIFSSIGCDYHKILYQKWRQFGVAMGGNKWNYLYVDLRTFICDKFVFQKVLKSYCRWDNSSGVLEEITLENTTPVIPVQ